MTNHSGFFYLLMSALFPQTHRFLLIFRQSQSINLPSKTRVLSTTCNRTWTLNRKLHIPKDSDASRVIPGSRDNRQPSFQDGSNLKDSANRQWEAYNTWLIWGERSLLLWFLINVYFYISLDKHCFPAGSDRTPLCNHLAERHSYKLMWWQFSVLSHLSSSRLMTLL